MRTSGIAQLDLVYDDHPLTNNDSLLVCTLNRHNLLRIREFNRVMTNIFYDSASLKGDYTHAAGTIPSDGHDLDVEKSDSSTE